ncbi:hypothetical protein VPH35_091214 [Triticum aestivum]
MEQIYREVFEKVSSSIVIVRQVPSGQYCIGSVLSSAPDPSTTVIVTSSPLAGQKDRVFVRFNDNTEVEAKRLASEDRFTLLEVVHYRANCSVEFSEIDVNEPSEAIILTPNSTSSLSHVPGFVIQPSCAARDSKMKRIGGSEKYFLVSCHFRGLINFGFGRIHNQLMSAPVFDLNGKVIGLLTSQCGMYKNKVDVKIGLLATHARVRQFFCEFRP